MKTGWRFRGCLTMTIFAMAAFAICCCSLRATTIEKMSLDRMTQMAPIIVHARCVASSTAWDAGDIWTFTTFNVLETWKAASGAPIPPRITVRLLGGTVGLLTSHVSGVPRFRPGEEVVLFLQRTSRGDFSVVSWQQGTFRIRRNQLSESETATVTQDSAAFATFDPKTRRFEATGIRNLSLTSFRQRIVTAIANGGGQ
ncbi:MAG: hypothetical protein ACRD8A_09485 [Candidatus Acidiferrales bacterium]